MKKKQPVTVATVAALAVGFYIFDKFGGVRAMWKGISAPAPPKSEVGHMSQAEWQARYGGSQTDYEDWLLGR